MHLVKNKIHLFYIVVASFLHDKGTASETRKQHVCSSTLRGAAVVSPEEQKAAFVMS